MTTTKRLAQGLFYLLVLAVLTGRAMTQVVSHDENQFIAAGQVLADHGWLPYRDYAYTHMPYAAVIYAVTARLSSYDYLAARLMGTLTWMGCIALLIVIFRLLARHAVSDRDAQPAWAYLLGEFVLILVLLYHPISSYVLGAALNHSFSTFFSLLAFLFYLRGVTRIMPLGAAALASGISISLATCFRLNFASLAVVLFVLWLLYLRFSERQAWIKPVTAFTGGVFMASLPAVAMAALAPAPFYYSNIAYIQLNTLYYRAILFKQTMDLPSKITAFLNGVIHNPIDIAFYSITLVAGLAFLLRFIRSRSCYDLIGLGAAAFAGTLFLTAFSPTPTQAHYFFAPLPFIILLVFVVGMALYQRSRRLYASTSVVLLIVLALSMSVPDALSELSALAHPSTWTPLQVHDFAESLATQQHVPQGWVLSLLPSLIDEAGYTPYPFTVPGPFVWRTSLLLSSARRAYYNVVSPEELQPLLDATPPVAILTGIEAPNAGFTFRDIGGLEKPLIHYAEQHGYKPSRLSATLLGRPITVWLRQP